MIIKELFEGPVGDYCIARNTIKCLLTVVFLYLYLYLVRCRTQLWFLYIGRECATLLAVLQESCIEALY